MSTKRRLGNVLRLFIVLGLLLQTAVPLFSTAHAQEEISPSSSLEIVSEPTLPTPEEPLPLIAAALLPDKAQVEAGEAVQLRLELQNIGHNDQHGAIRLTVLSDAGEALTTHESRARVWDFRPGDTWANHIATLNTNQLSDGLHAIQVVGHDKEGNELFATQTRILVGHSEGFAVATSQNGNQLNAMNASEPSAWSPRVVPPSPSTFSLSANYSYPIEVPPARGGVGPTLALAYNSRSIDGTASFQDSSLAGHGWFLGGIPYIQKNNVFACEVNGESYLCSDNMENYQEGEHPWTLNIGGQSYLLRRVSCDANYCRFEAYDAPGLLVERSVDFNDGIRVRTPDGMVFYFGTGWNSARQDETRQIMAPVNGTPGLPGGAIYKYLLDRVEDPFGHVMTVNYEEFESACAGGSCREMQVRPVSILFNNNVTGIFDPSADSAPAVNPENEAHWDSKVVFNWAATHKNRDDYSGLTPLQVTAFHLTSVDVFERDNSWSNPLWSYTLNKTEMAYSSDPTNNDQLSTRCLYNAPSSVRGCWISRLDSVSRTEDGDTRTTSFSYENLVMGSSPHPDWCDWADNNGFPGLTLCSNDPDNGYQTYTYPILSRIDDPAGATFLFRYNDDPFGYWESGGNVGSNLGNPGGIFHSQPVELFAMWDGVEHTFGSGVATSATRFFRHNDGSGRNVPFGPCRSFGAGCTNSFYAPVGSDNAPNPYLVGYRHVWTESYGDFNVNTNSGMLLGSSKQNFYDSSVVDESSLLFGRPLVRQQFDANGVIRGRTDHHWEHSELAGTACTSAGYGAHWGCMEAMTTTHFSESGATTTVLVTTYEYDDGTPQGDRQWGQATRKDLYVNGLHDSFQLLRYATNESVDEWALRLRTTGVWDGSHDVNPGNGGALQISHQLYNNETDPNDQAITRDAQVTHSIVISDLVKYNAVDNGDIVTLQTVNSAYVHVDGQLVSGTTFNEHGTIDYQRDSSASLFDWKSFVAPPASSGATATFEYDARERMTSSTDPLGLVTSYVYNDVFGTREGHPWQLGRVLNSFGSGGQTNQLLMTDLFYDEFGRLVERHGPATLGLAEVVMRYSYDLGNPITTVTEESYPDITDESLQGEAVRTFDGLGRVIESRVVEVKNEQAGNALVDLVTTFAYDGAGRVICESLPQTVAVGAPATPCLATVDPPKRVRTTYDPAGRVQQVIQADGVQVDVTYASVLDSAWVGHNDLGGVRQVQTRVSENGTTHRCTIQTQNELQQVIWIAQWDEDTNSTSDCMGDRLAITRYGYDVVGNMVSVIRGGHLEGNSYSGEAVTTTAEYDDLGRKVGMVDPDMGEWVYSYNAAGNVLREIRGVGTADQAVTCAEYDVPGRITGEWRELSGTTCGTMPTNPDDARFLASYTYDDTVGEASRGQLTHIRWNPHLEAAGLVGEFSDTFTYDSQGRPDTHTRVVNGMGFAQEVLVYDVASRPVSVLNPAGETITTEFDSWGGQRLLVDGQALVDDISYNIRGQRVGLDRANGVDSSFTYRGIGQNHRLKDVTVSNATETLTSYTYTYDDLGQITQIVSDVDGVSETETFAYDTLGRVTSAGSSLGDYNLIYQYDSLSNLTGVFGDINGNIVFTSYSDTGSFGFASPHAVGSMTAGGAVFNYDYDATGQMTVRETANGTFLQTFNELGQLTQVEREANGATTHFAYDPSGIRVLTLDPDGTLTYTPFANYTLEVRPEATLTANLADTTATMCLVKAQNYQNYQILYGTCEANVSSHTFTLPPQDPAYPLFGVAVNDDLDLVSAQPQDGQLVYAPEGTGYLWAYWEYGNHSVTLETMEGTNPPPPTVPTMPSSPANAATIERITYLLDGITVATRVVGDPAGNDGLYYMHGNHLGSLSLMTDENGQIVDDTKAKFLPFGGYRQEPTSDLSDRGFTGHRENRDLGLTYMNARYYAPELRRFISADTIIPEPMNTIGWNRFAYVNNNPINFIDPSGHCAKQEDNDEEYQKCVDEYNWLIAHGADESLIGTLEDYTRREDFDIIRDIILKYGQFGLTLADIWHFTWTLNNNNGVSIIESGSTSVWSQTHGVGYEKLTISRSGGNVTVLADGKPVYLLKLIVTIVHTYEIERDDGTTFRDVHATDEMYYLFYRPEEADGNEWEQFMARANETHNSVTVPNAVSLGSAVLGIVRNFNPVALGVSVITGLYNWNDRSTQARMAAYHFKQILNHSSGVISSMHGPHGNPAYDITQPNVHYTFEIYWHDLVPH